MELIESTPFPDMFERVVTCQSDPTEVSNICLQQGDIIEKSDEIYEFDRWPDSIGCLVVSNSCDLEHRNVRAIHLVPIYPFDSWYMKHSKKPLDKLTTAIYEEANYKRKESFFISPLNEFDRKPSIAFVDDIISIPFSKHLFNWQEVPGIDEARFRSVLSMSFDIDWVMDTNIEKIDRNKVIKAFTDGTDNRSLTLTLNRDRKNVSLTIDDGRTEEYIVIEGIGALNVAFSNHNLLLKHRICSLKPPWREQLGHKLGNLFNRISTYTPEIDKIKPWAKEYKEGLAPH